MPLITNHDYVTRRLENRQHRATRFLRELETVANAHCETQRWLGLPVSNNTLMLTLRNAFAIGDLEFIEGFCRRYAEDWTRLEESETHKSVREDAR